MTLEPWSLLAVAILAAVYAGGIGIHEGRLIHAHTARPLRWSLLSAAAGVSVAYVFIDVLPELAAQNQALRATAGSELRFAEQRVYLPALLSFVVMYGLEHIVLTKREDRKGAVANRERDSIYWLHLVGFAAYSALIGSLLVERAVRGSVALGAYTLAMAVHFIVVNHALSEEHGDVYRRHGRWVLAGSVIAGWALGSAFALSEAAFARLFAVLAGGVVITSLRAELPDDRRGRFWPFCLAAILFAAALLFT